MKKGKKIAIICIALVAVIAVLIGIYVAFMPKGTQGAKAINIAVIANGETVKEYKINTDAEFLRAALEDENIIKGSESDYGLFVTEVAGIIADDAKNEWWCFSKDGEMLMTGVDQTPVADGDSFEITLSTY